MHFQPVICHHDIIAWTIRTEDNLAEGGATAPIALLGSTTVVISQ